MCMCLALTTSLACVPIVGAVLAVVGVIATIVEIILGKVCPPKSPAQIFIENEGPDFFGSITIDQKVIDKKAEEDKKKH